MKQITLKKRVLVWWECAAFLAAILLAALVLLIFVPGTWLWYLLLWVLGAVYVLTSFLYLPLLWMSIIYCIDDTCLMCHGGVLFPKTRVMHRERIAFITRVQGPVSSMLHIATLVVRAAGGAAVVHMVHEKQAEELEQELYGGIE